MWVVALNNCLKASDFPKYEAHQEKLDAFRQSVEDAISTSKIALIALDKAILEKTKGTSEQSQQEVNTPATSTQEGATASVATPQAIKATKQDVSDITENQKTGIWEKSQLSNLERVIGSFVTVKDITPEEYRQGKGSVYERAWALVKTAYSSTAKHITELMAKLS